MSDTPAPETDSFDELLLPGTPPVTTADWQQAVLLRTTGVLRRRRWYRRAGFATALAACYLAGLATRDPEHGMGVNNRGRYSNPVFDKQLADALNTMDDKKRERLIEQAAETVMNDTGLIPIHFEVSTWATVKGYRYTPRTDQYTLVTDLRPVTR